MSSFLKRYLLLVVTPLLILLTYLKWYDYLLGNQFPQIYMEGAYWTLVYTLVFLIIDVVVNKHVNNIGFLSYKKVFVYVGLVFLFYLILGNISTVFELLRPIQENFVLHILFIYFVGFATAKFFLFTVVKFTKDE